MLQIYSDFQSGFFNETHLPDGCRQYLELNSDLHQYATNVQSNLSIMRIVGFKPDHDGSLVVLNDGRLEYLLEAEKNSRPRHSNIHPHEWLSFLSRLRDIPDVIAVGGWHADRVSSFFPQVRDSSHSYLGLEEGMISSYSILGKDVRLFESSHERSHLMCCLGMSSIAQNESCYVLIWEGTIGCFYKVGSDCSITRIGSPLGSPGIRYEYLYYLGCDDQSSFYNPINSSGPGKLMALAAFGDRNECLPEDRKLIEFLLSPVAVKYIAATAKSVQKRLPFECTLIGNGVQSQRFKNVARAFTDAIFDLYFQFAISNLHEYLPLLIGGGCGLNCEWNSRWRDSGLFSSIFIPPCVNDSGSALGTAIDAHYAITGRYNIDWNPYVGDEIKQVNAEYDGFAIKRFDVEAVVEILINGGVIAWARGKCEIGPRALGNRSILAAPYHSSMTDRLNKIKGRELYRPIAPICVLEEVSSHFDWEGSSPYMLYFQKVINRSLQAVTHIDGTARVQTVTKEQNAAIYELLKCYGRRTGASVLCNTSLNRRGEGFFNDGNDILDFVTNRSLDAAVIEDRIYLNLSSPILDKTGA